MLVISSPQSHFRHQTWVFVTNSLLIRVSNRGMYFNELVATVLDFTPQRKYLEKRVLAGLPSYRELACYFLPFLRCCV